MSVVSLAEGEIAFLERAVDRAGYQQGCATRTPAPSFYSPVRVCSPSAGGFQNFARIGTCESPTQFSRGALLSVSGINNYIVIVNLLI